MTNKPVIALFVTCIVDQLYPEIGIATVKLLERAGFEVAFPKSQTCCGQPFFNSGFHDEAARLAKQTIEILEPYEKVVLPSGSCATMMRVEYAHLLSGDPAWGDRAKHLASKTFELSEFLVENGFDVEDAEPARRTATYHDSCHMCRTLNLKTKPRKALRKTGIEIEEMFESDRCCGFGGLFSIRLPEVSNAMTLEKLRQAQETDSHLLITADPGCLMQMRKINQNQNLQIEHIATILEERTR